MNPYERYKKEEKELFDKFGYGFKYVDHRTGKACFETEEERNERHIYELSLKKKYS